jgi:hypothetical protein
MVAVRWVYVYGGTGTHRDKDLFITDLRMSPK